MTTNPIPDEGFADAHLAAAAEVQLPGITVNGRGEIVVEIDGGDQAVAGYRDADGDLVIETSQPTWNGSTAEQVALGILSVLRWFHVVEGGAA